MRHYEVFTGRVGQVKDLVELSNGNCVVNFSVAETPRVKKQDGTWEDGTTIWTNVSLFGDEARNFVRSVKPGTFITVSGYRNAREYTPNDSNETRTVQQVTAEQISVAITKFNFIESVGNVNYAKEGRGGGAPAQTQSYNQTQAPAQTQQTPAASTPAQDPFSQDPFAESGNDDPFGAGNDDPFNLNS